MDNRLTILIVEAETDECIAFKRYVETIDDVCIIGITNNTSKAYEMIISLKPDAIILDIELLCGHGDGITLLVTLKKTSNLVFPYILVTTSNISKTTHNQVRLLGADFIMIKGEYNDYCAEKVIDFLREVKGIIKKSNKEKTVFSVNEEPVSSDVTVNSTVALVSVEFDLIGISTKLDGYDYLVEAVLLVLKGNRKFIADIAIKHSKTDASIIRSMQYAINKTWRNNEIEMLNRYYTAHINPQSGVPTLNEFVFYYANRVKYHLYA